MPQPRGPVTSPPYVELHAHSGFSFLDGASHPEELVLRAKELGYPALALTDHNGLYGSMEFARAAKENSTGSFGRARPARSWSTTD